MGIALLQNEQLPTFLPVNVIEELVTSTNDRCMVNLQQGLGVFWISHDVLESASITSSNKANNSQAYYKITSQLIVP